MKAVTALGKMLLLATVGGCGAYYTDYSTEYAALRTAQAGGREPAVTASQTRASRITERARVQAPTSPGVLGDPQPPAGVSREVYPRQDERSPTDSNSAFDDRFDRRTYRDDVNRVAPRQSGRSDGVWQREFDPDR